MSLPGISFGLLKKPCRHYNSWWLCRRRVVVLCIIQFLAALPPQNCYAVQFAARTPRINLKSVFRRGVYVPKNSPRIARGAVCPKSFLTFWAIARIERRIVRLWRTTEAASAAKPFCRGSPKGPSQLVKSIFSYMHPGHASPERGGGARRRRGFKPNSLKFAEKWADYEHL